jgi:hypothetical protein
MTREDCVKIIIKVLNCSLNTAEFIMEGIDPYVSELQKEKEKFKEIGFREGWRLAHEPARCGHARANYKDPKYGTLEYQGDEKCEACSLFAELQKENEALKKQIENEKTT